MFKAATDGATPSEGLLNRMFKIGNSEISIRNKISQNKQVSQMCGRLEALEPDGQRTSGSSRYGRSNLDTKS